MDDAAVVALVVGPDFRRATFAGRPRGMPTPWVRVTIRPVEVRGNRLLQLTQFDGKKTFSKNLTFAEAGPVVAELLASRFAGVHLSTATEEIDLRTSKKGKTTVGRSVAGQTVPGADQSALDPSRIAEHNRTKNLPLPEGRPDRLLEVMGVADATGRVKPTMRGKFTQINEFLKHLSHALAAADLVNLGRPLSVLDCGCGASYLTLAAHHYLNHVRGVPTQLIGVDVNDELVRKSLAKAESLGATGLSFACGRIGEADVSADVVIALHACDTATDDALIQAVRSGARLILSAPCCHRHQKPSVGSNRTAAGTPAPRHPSRAASGPGDRRAAGSRVAGGGLSGRGGGICWVGTHGPQPAHPGRAGRNPGRTGGHRRVSVAEGVLGCRAVHRPAGCVPEA